jgi:hypothetical protein
MHESFKNKLFDICESLKFFLIENKLLCETCTKIHAEFCTSTFGDTFGINFYIQPLDNYLINSTIFYDDFYDFINSFIYSLANYLASRFRMINAFSQEEYYKEFKFSSLYSLEKMNNSNSYLKEYLENKEFEAIARRLHSLFVNWKDVYFTNRKILIV